VYQDAPDAGTIITTVVLDIANGAKKNRPILSNAIYAVAMLTRLGAADMCAKIAIRQTMTDKKKNVVRPIGTKSPNPGVSNANGKKKTGQAGNYKISKPK
jgi:hypothetical protein